MWQVEIDKNDFLLINIHVNHQTDPVDIRSGFKKHRLSHDHWTCSKSTAKRTVFLWGSAKMSKIGCNRDRSPFSLLKHFLSMGKCPKMPSSDKTITVNMKMGGRLWQRLYGRPFCSFERTISYNMNFTVILKSKLWRSNKLKASFRTGFDRPVKELVV